MNHQRSFALQTTKSELLGVLTESQVFQETAARTVLLTGVPNPGVVHRSESQVTDLSNIVNHAVDQGRTALDVLRDNTLRYFKLDPRSEKVKICFQKLSSLLLGNVKDGSREQFPFTNRENEKKLILVEDSPAHHIIDGPAGYGKTEMLCKLEEIFSDPEHNYVCARVTIDKNNKTIGTIVKALCEHLELDANKVVGGSEDVKLVARQFATEILRTKFSDLRDSQTYEGLVLLLDDIGPQHPELTRQLLEVFIPQLGSALRAKKFFSNRPNAFRVIMSGRNLAPFVTALVPRLTWLPMITILNPFDYVVVCDTARKVLVEYENIEQTSAHIVHLTGGHPKCMAWAIEFYRDNPCAPEAFLELYSERTWNEVVRNTTEDIRNSIPDQLRPVCDRLSVFRVFNYEILEQLAGDQDYPKDIDFLYDELAATHLYDTRAVRYVRDAIVRRMLVMRLSHNVGASEFGAICNEAFDRCFQLLKERDGLRDLWGIECLFQALQQHTHNIGTVEQRQAHRKVFIEEVVPTVVTSFLRGAKKQDKKQDSESAIDPRVQKRVQEQELKALVSEMNQEHNWDFRFTVNYFLREEFYSEEPFAELEKTVRNSRMRGE